MLTRLTVENLAVLTAVEVEFGPGFNVLTGETGAGKSLLVDALGLVLGNRGSSTLVRTGAGQATVTAEFTLTPSSPACKLLNSREIPIENNELLLHRSITADGRSRAWINGVPVPIGFLREIGEHLVEIHGQHEHLALARSEHQRMLLDCAAGSENLSVQVAQTATVLRRLEETLSEAKSAGAQRREKLDTLRFQLRELDELGPREGEYQDLGAEYERLHDRERTEAAYAQALGALEEGEGSASATLGRAQRALKGLHAPSAELAEAIDLLFQAESLVSEALRLLRPEAQAEADPAARLEWLNTRIARYQTLARKHAVDPASLAALKQRLTRENDALETGDQHLAKLADNLHACRSEYEKLATELSSKRRRATVEFSTQVTQTMRELGMPQAEFSIHLESVSTESYPPGGRERVNFLVTTNPDQRPGPIARIASGGELSRIALAVEVLGDPSSGTPVMVFDEVDAGIGGRVADLVGRCLKALAGHRQILCVTHLPQVAALANHHFEVRKLTTATSSSATIEPLDEALRVEAIAAMLGGLRVTESARRHARALIQPPPR